MNEPLTFVLWLWQGKTMGDGRVDYVADHVNRAASMLSRHVTRPHEVVCVTDMPDGIVPWVRIVPMWDDLADLGKCYRRLKVFDPAMREVLGPRVVSMDLDTVITGNLDHLFAGDEPFKIWGDRVPRAMVASEPYCGSLFMLTPGYRPDVFTSFDPGVALDLRKRYGFVGSDQAWMSHVIKGAPTWTKADGVYSFRLDIKLKVNIRSRGRIAGRGGATQTMRRGDLPPEARIVFFHGLEDPSQTHLHVHHKWILEHWK